MVKINILEVICDSGPIIHLDELKCLELLSDFKKVLLVPAVYKEIIKFRPKLRNNLPENFRIADTIAFKPDFITLCNLFSLDIGEMEALAIMPEYSKSIFLTDDASARLVAEKMGYNVHGTIGIVIRSIRRKQKSKEEVLNILKSIPDQSSLYIKQSFLNQIISLIQES